MGFHYAHHDHFTKRSQLIPLFPHHVGPLGSLATAADAAVYVTAATYFAFATNTATAVGRNDVNSSCTLSRFPLGRSNRVLLRLFLCNFDGGLYRLQTSVGDDIF